MAAYLISDLTVRDRAAFETYRTRAADAKALSRNLILVDGVKQPAAVK